MLIVQDSFEYLPEFPRTQRGTSQAFFSAIHCRNPKTSFIHREREEGCAGGAHEQRYRLAGPSVVQLGWTYKQIERIVGQLRANFPNGTRHVAFPTLSLKQRAQLEHR